MKKNIMFLILIVLMSAFSVNCSKENIESITDVGPLAVCGNNIIEENEGCDDGNTITESCLYGETSCTVCDSTCSSVAGVLTGYCGDSITNGP
ncbi:MAG: hypothetical protein OEZ22_07380, partial [Spirochaetia bacterium]|nr:hypothetical protein [Spirochaetia bacterium]